MACNQMPYFEMPYYMPAYPYPYLVLCRDIGPGSEQKLQTADVAGFGGKMQWRHTLLQLVRGWRVAVRHSLFPGCAGACGMIANAGLIG